MPELSGELTLKTVTDLYQQFSLAHKHGKLPERIDLAGLERTDSSALALILELQSWARKADTTIQWSNPPESLRVLADLSQASELLGWKTTNEN